jgi:hypothetical protein
LKKVSEQLFFISFTERNCKGKNWFNKSIQWINIFSRGVFGIKSHFSSEVGGPRPGLPHGTIDTLVNHERNAAGKNNICTCLTSLTYGARGVEVARLSHG